MRFIKATRLGLALSLTVPLLAGCLNNEYEATVGANDTVTGSFVTYTSVETIRQEESPSGKTPDELEAEWRGLTAEIVKSFASRLDEVSTNNSPAALVAKDISNEEIVGLEISFENLPFPTGKTSEFDGQMGLFGLDFSMSRDGDNQVLVGTIGQKKPESFDDFAAPGMLPVLALMDEGLEPTVNLAVTFAGPVEETNGQVENNTVTWQGPLFGATKIEATANVPFQEGVGPAVNEQVGGGGGLSPMLMVTGALLIAFLVGGLYVFVTGRRQTEPTDDYDDEYEDDEYEDYEDDDYEDDEYEDDEYEDYEDDDYEEGEEEYEYDPRR